jgi:hypothetical protein
MNQNLPVLIFVAACALGATQPAAAQGVYRCGDSYGQKPCAGGALVPTDDARSDAQRAAAREAAQRNGKAADAMEKARLKEEAKPAQVYLGPPANDPAAGEENLEAAARPRKPQYFTAAAPRRPGEAALKKKSKQKKKKGTAAAKKNDV